MLLCKERYPDDSVMAVVVADLAAFCQIWMSTTEGGPTSARGIGGGVDGSQSGAKVKCAGEEAEHCGERRNLLWWRGWKMKHEGKVGVAL